jgi:hypothetical protein
MKVEFSIHALERMNARGILKEDVTAFLKNYDSLSNKILKRQYIPNL